MFAAFDVGDRDDRGFRQHDAAAFDVNQRVCRTEVDRHVGGHDAENSTKHSKPSREIRTTPVEWVAAGLVNTASWAEQGLQPPLGCRKCAPAFQELSLIHI